MMRPVLYSFRRCPYAMRARMGLLSAGVEVELREVVLRDKPAEMIAASPKATVPVLILPNAEVIEESLDVMDWALAQADPEDLLSIEPDVQRALVQACDRMFKPHLDRYKYPNRYADEPSADHRGLGLAWIMTHLAPRLETASNLFGARPMYADIAMFPFVRQFAHVDAAWFYETVPASVSSWLKAHIGSARFKAVMTKYDQWQSGETGVVFPS